LDTEASTTVPCTITFLTCDTASCTSCPTLFLKYSLEKDFGKEYKSYSIV
jgi:hypothetical protein